MTQLALVIDLNVCVGCHACVTSCKEWNTSGSAGPLADLNPYGADPTGTFFNRVQTFEVGEYPEHARRCTSRSPACTARTRPACRCARPARRYKREEDGIVLVDYDKCIGCKYCSWACPYGVRELDEQQQGDEEVHAVRRPHLRRRAARGASASPPACMACPTSARLFGDIHDPGVGGLAWRSARARGYALMPEWGTHPANHYLPRRKTELHIHEDELERADNPLKVDGLLPKPAKAEPSLDDVTSW